jgi:hypothetical protein
MREWAVGEKVVLYGSHGSKSIGKISRLTKTTIELKDYTLCRFDVVSGRGKGDFAGYSRPWIDKLTPALEMEIRIANTQRVLKEGFQNIEVTPDNIEFLRDRIADINQFKKKE